MKTTSSLLLWLPLLLFAWAIESPVAAQQPALAIPAAPGKSGPPVKPAPPLKGVIPRKVRCLSHLFPSCYNQWHFCPVECAKTCLLDCVLCKPVCSKLSLNDLNIISHVKYEMNIIKFFRLIY